MTATPPPLNGLRHLALVVENFDECERFYRDILGMRELSRFNDDLVYLTLGNDNLSLGRSVMVADDLAEGRLVRPFAFGLPAPQAYYLVCVEGTEARPKIAAFRQWLMAEFEAA